MLPKIPTMLAIAVLPLLAAVSAQADEGKMDWLKSLGQAISKESKPSTDEPAVVAGTRGLRDEAKKEDSEPAAEESTPTPPSDDSTDR